MIDGDDWLASRGVFAFINQEYADKNVWFTYGQYRNEPAQEAEKWGFSAKGYCKPVSRRLQKRKIYRSRQFVYMHVRTFYAWLFKLIKLEDLIAMKVQGFEGDFYPASNDLAMYYPIAEMANKRVRFISKVLYIRNLFSDIVGFKVDSKLQHAASTEIRKKQLYAQRTRPAKSRINKFQQAKADLFLFCSKRDVIEADAIYHIMEQIKGVNTIYVFYVDSIENNKKIKELQQSFSSVQFISYNPNKAMAFKESILEQLDNSPSDHILLLTDKIIITEPIDMQELIQWLEQTFALAFYLDRGEEEKGVPRHVELNDTICAWKFTISKGKWKSMYRVNGALYRKWNLKKKLEDGEFCTLANLKQQLKKNEPDSKKMGLFYKKRRVRLNDGK